MTKKQIKDELTIQHRVNDAMIHTLNENSLRIAELKAEIQTTKSRAFDLLSEQR